MKCEVKLFVSGTVFKEEFIFCNYQERHEVAFASDPKAKALSITADIIIHFFYEKNIASARLGNRFESFPPDQL